MGFQQTEMAAILGVTQGTISKVEAADMKIEMTLWFEFVRKFRLKDSYCCLYGSLELESLDEISIKEFKSPFFSKGTLFHDNRYFLVKDIRPLIDLLHKRASLLLEEMIDTHKIYQGVFNINNHPLYFSLVEDILTNLNKTLINKKLQDLNLEFDATFGLHEELKDFETQLTMIQKASRWCKYGHLKKNQYQVSFTPQDYSFLKKIKNSELLIEYLILVPFLFYSSSTQKKSSLAAEIKEEEKHVWKVTF